MDSAQRDKVRAIVSKHIDRAVEDLSEEDIGYWPDDAGTLVDAVMVVLEHQERIDQYHKKNQSDFSK